MKKIACSIILLLLISNVAIGVIAKMNFKYTEYEDLSTLQTWSIDFETHQFQKKIVEIQNLEQLIALSDKVSLIKWTEEPIFYQGYIRHSIEIIKDYKTGDQTKEINLLEEVWLSNEGMQDIMSTTQGYVPLIRESLYVVFLKKADNSYLQDAYSYTHPVYTKFVVQEGELKIISGNRTTFSMDELKGIDIIDFNQQGDELERNIEYLSIYNDIKQDFHEMFSFE